MSGLKNVCESAFPFALECTIAVTVLMLITWAAVRLMLTPALRHRALTGALFISLLVPAALQFGRPYAPSFSSFIWRASPIAEVQDFAQPSPSKTKATDETMPASHGASAQSPVAGWRNDGLVSGLICIWLLGSFCHFGMLVKSWLHMAQLRRTSLKVTNPETRDLVRRFAHSLGISKPVTTRCSPSIRVPMATSVWSPCILLPTGFAKWSTERLELAVRHELTHIARRDVAAQVIAELAAMVYWFHPLVRFAERSLRLERELACDDSLVLSGWASSDYATHLVDIASNLSTAAPPRLAVAMASSDNLETRIRHLLQDNADRRPVGRLAGFLLVSIAALLLAMLGIGTPIMATEEVVPESTTPASATAKEGDAEKKKTDEAVVLLMHPAELARGNSIQRFAASRAINALKGGTRCGILLYGPNGTQWLWEKPELTIVGEHRDKLLAAVASSRTGDFPDFQPAFEMALDALQKADVTKRRMLVLTDGDPSPPSKKLLAKFKTAGIPITVVHPDIHNLGNKGMAQKIAAATGGRYYHIRKATAKIIGAIFHRENSGKTAKQLANVENDVDSLSKPADLYVPAPGSE